MQKYQSLFFDVDDTLLDFRATEKEALGLLFEALHMSFTDEIEVRYKNINKVLWKAFEEGKIDLDEVLNTRHSLLFKELGQEVDGAEVETKYRSFLEAGHQHVDGAIELIADLQKKYDLYIVTNGISKTQDRRLRDSGLHPFFQGIFVSEDTGFRKPMKEFFDHVFARIPDFSVERGLIIGDSVSADIRGGQLAGLDTCWFNPERKPNETDIVPTYEIHSLEELYQILNAEKGAK